MILEFAGAPGLAISLDLRKQFGNLVELESSERLIYSSSPRCGDLRRALSTGEHVPDEMPETSGVADHFSRMRRPSLNLRYRKARPNEPGLACNNRRASSDILFTSISFAQIVFCMKPRIP